MLLRVNTDIIIETDDDPQDVCSTIQIEGAQNFDDFPHGEIIKFDVLSQGRVTDEEAHERGWVE